MSHCTGVIVLAAGKGTRMKATTTNKVAMPLFEKPIIAHTIENIREAGLEKIVVVVGFAKESVKEVLGTSVVYAEQEEQLGTGHAVAIGLAKVPPECDQLISMYGDDSAFYPPILINSMIAEHQQKNAKVTVLTIEKADPTGLGRIIRGDKGELLAIVEEKVANLEQKKIKEINTGLYCFDRAFLEEGITQIKKNAVSGEMYLTDIIEVAVKNGQKVEAMKWTNSAVWHGINNPDELLQAREKMKRESNE